MRRLFSRRRVEADLAEELQAHLELLTERYAAQGMTHAEARAAAVRQLGNTTRVREDVREASGVRWLDTIARDTRYAVRQIARDPVVATVVILTVRTLQS
jgi:hypothetical protein